jgi:hypothetical protein
LECSGLTWTLYGSCFSAVYAFSARPLRSLAVPSKS